MQFTPEQQEFVDQARQRWVAEDATWDTRVALWVEALRSGLFPQGRDCLWRDGKFCCLGVLCALTPQDDVTSHGRNVDWENRAHLPMGLSHNFATDMRFSGLYGAFFDVEVPKDVQERLLFLYEDGSLTGDSLAELNDGGVSFADIAQLIEEYPELLFRREDAENTDVVAE